MVTTFAKNHRPLLAFIAAAIFATQTDAANITKADGSAALNTAAAWVGGVPPNSSDVAVWDSTVLAAYTSNLGANTNWAGIQILNPGGAVTITNLNTTLFIGGSGVDTSSGSQALTLGCAVALVTNSANNVWNIGSNVTLTNGLSGTNILQKTGSGTLAFNTILPPSTCTVQIDQGVVSSVAGNFAIILNGGQLTESASGGSPINVTSAGGTVSASAKGIGGLVTGSGIMTVISGSTFTFNGNLFTNFNGTLTTTTSTQFRPSSTAFTGGTNMTVDMGSSTANWGPNAANQASSVDFGALFGGASTVINGAGKLTTYSIGAKNIDCNYSGSIKDATGFPVTVVKTGGAKLALDGANTYTGSTIISNGVFQVGNGGSSGSIASPVVFVTNSTSILSFNRSDTALNFTNLITGIGSVQQNGSGITFLSGPSGGTGANNYSGGTVLNNGILKIATGALGSGGVFFTNSATLQWAAGNTADISSQAVTVGSGGGTLDVNGNTVTLANSIGNSGSGALTVKSTAANGVLILQGANTYSGGTTISSGTLKANNASGSATGSGNVTVSSGATIGGTGTVSGLVDVQGFLAPGNSGVGTLTVDSLTLESTATNNFEFNSTPANDKVVVTASGGFLVNGGAFNLYTAGGTTAWTTPGTYNLIQYSGTAPSLDSTWTTASGSNPHIANPQTGYQYAFSATSGFLKVTITVVSTAVVGIWNVDANGNWTDATKWSSNPNVPHAAGDSATLGTASVLRTVTLNANETIGALVMNNANSFVIASAGNTLTFDSGGSGAAVTVSAGTANAIQTAVALNDNASVSVAANSSLSVTSVVANASTAKTLTVSGSGTLALSGNNTYGPAASSGFGTVLNGGTLQVGNSSALGAGDVSVSASGTLQAGAAALMVANNIDVASGVAATVDNNGNNLTLSGVISDSGSLTKAGSGVLTLAGSSTYSGNTTINAGVLSVSADANVGSTPNIILNGGNLLGTASFTLSSAHNIGIGASSGAIGTNALIDAASGQTFEVDGVVASAGNSGADNLVVNSGAGNNGTVALNAANTFNGLTVISNGTLQVMNSLALQNTTLNYNSGTLTFNGIAAATLGGLAGTNNLDLTNSAGGLVSLTIGNNNSSTIYGGNLNSATLASSLTKTGTGTLTLTGTNAYNGSTTVGNGTGTLLIAGGSLTTSNTLSVQGSGKFEVTNNASVSVPTIALGTVNGTGAGSVVVDSGTNSFGNLTIGGSSNGGSLAVNGGTVSILTFRDIRDASAGTGVATTTSGVIINGGSTTISNVLLSTGNSGADLTVSNGVLTVGSALSTSNFVVGLGTSTSRGGFVTVRGGTVTYLGADGMLLNNAPASQGTAQFDGGVSTFAGITMNNQPVLTNGNAVLSMNGGTLYLGGIGLVMNTQLGGSTASVTLTTGTLGATADWSSSASMTLAGNFTVRAADAAAVAHNITLSGVLSGNGGLTKTGTGTLVLSGANTYTNNTTVSAGILELDQPSLFTNSTISVASGATLNLNFVGTNQVNALVLNGVSKPGGLYGNGTDPTFLTGTGKILVAPSINPNAGPIRFGVTNNVMTLSWPTNSGWTLQQQTNSLSTGLGTNWVDVTGSTSITSTNITLDPTKPTVFYRLKL